MKWAPQIEILNHPALKAGLSHCGWGGVLEFVQAGKPVICWPHFGDQWMSSQMLINVDAAILLGGSDRFGADPEKMYVYKHPIFD